MKLTNLLVTWLLATLFQLPGGNTSPPCDRCPLVVDTTIMYDGMPLRDWVQCNPPYTVKHKNADGTVTSTLTYPGCNPKLNPPAKAYPVGELEKQQRVAWWGTDTEPKVIYPDFPYAPPGTDKIVQ